MDKVSVVMSIYKPNPVYLKQQLESLNQQTFENIELLVWNDCPEEEIDKKLFKEMITKFPVTFFNEKKNLGYTKAFEELSKRATGEYISYCDQDDIWDKDKISLCVKAINVTNSVAAVCDMSLMNGDGKVYLNSVRKKSNNKAETWKTGDDITTRAAFMSYCTGMTLLVRRRAIQPMFPFISKIAHDQQLVFLLSGAGSIACVEKPLVKYRRHSNNASHVLYGVEKKKDYYDTRCKPVSALLDRYEQLYPNDSRISEMRKCCAARINGNITGLWKYRNMIPDLYIYEIGLAFCPDFIFRAIKKMIH